MQSSVCIVMRWRVLPKLPFPAHIGAVETSVLRFPEIDRFRTRFDPTFRSVHQIFRWFSLHRFFAIFAIITGYWLKLEFANSFLLTWSLNGKFSKQPAPFLIFFWV